MQKTIRSAAVGVLALAGVVAASTEAGAMPLPNLTPTVAAGAGIDKAYVVCGRWRCWHRYGWRRRYWRW